MVPALQVKLLKVGYKFKEDGDALERDKIRKSRK